MGIRHIRLFVRGAACALAMAACLAGAASASAAVPATCDDAAFNFDTGDVCRVEPFSPLDGQTAREKKLGSTGAPDDDLLQALRDLQIAHDDAEVARAQGRALAILKGDDAPLIADDAGFLAGKAYADIPLLNTDAKVKDNLPPGATVDVYEVRYGDQALLDTSMLRFLPEAMDTPFTIRWHVTELGTSFGGELTPAVLPNEANAEGGVAVAQPLVVGPLDTGTKTISRFHPAEAGEETRLVTQAVEVQMPAPNTISAILDPNLKPGHETFAQIAVGSTDDPDNTPDMPDAGGIAGDSPERQIRDGLTGLKAGDLASANEFGAGAALLVDTMRSRDALPVQSQAAPDADINVQFLNAKAYVAQRELRLAPGEAVDIAVTNMDDVSRTFTVRQLRDREQKFGVFDWGTFRTDVLRTVTVGPRATETVPVTPAASAFTLWLSDPAGGDQAGTAVALDRGPRRQTLEVGEGGILPLHQVLDREGNVWVTLEGSDEIMRLTPSADQLDTRDGADRFPLPGGITDKPPANGAAAEPIFGPADIAIDGQGIIWATLVAGNAIARIDPAEVERGTPNGIKIIDLTPCDETTCRTPPPPLTPGPLSRFPLQMEVHEDGAGNTVIFFTEQNADRIGALRVSPEGDKLKEAHYHCDCAQPLGIALDPDGAVWFSEGSSNRLGRLTLNQSSPFSPVGHTVDHYVIPNPVVEFVPGQQPCTPPSGRHVCEGGALPNPARTALPHSVAVDRRGRVWYTGEANERIGYLDPAKAVRNTSSGFTDVPGPKNEFKRALAPADIAFDRDGTAYFSDEYGDQIVSATVSRDDGSITAKTAFRPSARNSLTDSPMVDDQGNLWFIESGANLIARISGVTAGLPRPAAPPTLTANTGTGRLTATGLIETDSVDVRLLRGTTEVTRARAVPVTDGAFAVTLPLRADDRVQVVPGGGENPPAAFSFRVANLTAVAGSDGAITGTALNGGLPLADSVTIEAGGRTHHARIDLTEGTYALSAAASAGGTVSWTAGTVSGTFRTVTPFDAPSRGGDGDPPSPTIPNPRPPDVPSVPVIPATPPGTTGSAPSSTGDAACVTSRWLERTGRGASARRTLPLLGLAAADARRCLGRPAKTTRAGRTERWVYAESVELRLTRGRVTGFTLLGKKLRSNPDRATVGTSVSSFRRALGTLVRERAGYRGLVALDGGRVADIRLTVRSGRVTKVSATVRPRTALDATAKRLLRSAR